MQFNNLISKNGIQDKTWSKRQRRIREIQDKVQKDEIQFFNQPVGILGIKKKRPSTRPSTTQNSLINQRRISAFQVI